MSFRSKREYYQLSEAYARECIKETQDLLFKIPHAKVAKYGEFNDDIFEWKLSRSLEQLLPGKLTKIRVNRAKL